MQKNRPEGRVLRSGLDTLPNGFGGEGRSGAQPEAPSLPRPVSASSSPSSWPSSQSSSSSLPSPFSLPSLIESESVRTKNNAHTHGGLLTSKSNSALEIRCVKLKVLPQSLSFRHAERDRSALYLTSCRTHTIVCCASLIVQRCHAMSDESDSQRMCTACGAKTPIVTNNSPSAPSPPAIHSR